jgi:hypothetical protein
MNLTKTTYKGQKQYPQGTLELGMSCNKGLDELI